MAGSSVKGFSLLEILVVVLLMGLATSTVMLAVPSKGGDAGSFDDLCHKYARTFAYISEQSMVENQVIGVYFTDEKMKIMRRERPDEPSLFQGDDIISRIIRKVDNYENYNWVDLKLTQIKSSYRWPEGVKVELQVGGIGYQSGSATNGYKKESLTAKFDVKERPQVFFYPSMELTPFTLKLASEEANEEFTISAQENGRITLIRGSDNETETF